MHRDWDNTVLGTLTLEPGRLVADVNSKRRADRLRREVAKRLGADAVFAGSRVAPIEQMMRRAGQDRKTKALQDPEVLDPNAQQALNELTARHWEAWLDERVPALGNHTPRQAAKTPIGRERLEALFADFAWKAANMPPHVRVDVAGLRRKLGM